MENRPGTKTVQEKIAALNDWLERSLPPLFRSSLDISMYSSFFGQLQNHKEIEAIKEKIKVAICITPDHGTAYSTKYVATFPPK